MIQTGLDVLVNQRMGLVRGRRVGLVTNAAAVTRRFDHTLGVLLKTGTEVRALFAPEHGLDAAGADASPIDDGVERHTRLPIYSLYGKHKGPTPDMLSDIDVILFDMQDVGVRFYTFTTTLFHVLNAAATNRRAVIVLDRPNPLNGVMVEGPLVDKGLESFISRLPVPIRHGLTVGELARYLVDLFHLDLELTVIEMQGWKRAMWFDETELPWVPISPGMPHLSTATVYPGTCLIEGTNLSEGRGTPLPFEILGAPWVDSYRLAQSLNENNLPGVRFRPHAFSPCDSKHAGSKCGGIQVHVTERNSYKPVETGVHLLAACLSHNPERFEFLSTSWEGTPPHLDLLMGTEKVRQGLLAGVPVRDICAEWDSTEFAYVQKVRPFLLYS